jgi:lysophospholipase L1-like esterase
MTRVGIRSATRSGAGLAAAGLAAFVAALMMVVLLVPAQASARPLYVSLGDSWSVGFQPINDQGQVTDRGGRETVGYDGYLLRAARQQYPNLHLVSLGCGGERSGTMVFGGKPCAKRRPWNGRSAQSSQLAYAERFLRANRGRVKLVSVVIGGNDLAPCARESDIVGCVTRGLGAVRRNIPIIARRLRAAVGPGVPIVGSGYADVLLGEWVYGGRALAEASVPIFRDLFMPALRRGYAAGGALFVDVAREWGTYDGFDETVNLPPYGEIPRNVATLCRLGWYCQANRDIHLKDAGYKRVADQHYRLLRPILVRQAARDRARARQQGAGGGRLPSLAG